MFQIVSIPNVPNQPVRVSIDQKALQLYENSLKFIYVVLHFCTIYILNSNNSKSIQVPIYGILNTYTIYYMYGHCCDPLELFSKDALAISRKIPHSIKRTLAHARIDIHIHVHIRSSITHAIYYMPVTQSAHA